MHLNNGYEIERKFLIEYPDISVLKQISGNSFAFLSQFYLSTGGRVRKIETEEKTVYIKTVKQHITDIKRKETEWEITKEEYEKELNNIKEGTHIIEKVRYKIPSGEHTLEIDVFPFWNDRAFLEVELKEEDEEFIIPEFIKIIKEVTADKRYRNSALAIQIINEEI